MAPSQTSCLCAMQVSEVRHGDGRGGSRQPAAPPEGTARGPPGARAAAGHAHGIAVITNIGPNMRGCLDGRSVANLYATCTGTYGACPPLFPAGTEFPRTLPFPYELCDALGLTRTERFPWRMLAVFEGMYNIVMKSADEKPPGGLGKTGGVALVLAFARKIYAGPLLSPYDRFGGKALGTACMRLVCRSGGDGESGSLPKKRRDHDGPSAAVARRPCSTRSMPCSSAPRLRGPSGWAPWASSATPARRHRAFFCSWLWRRSCSASCFDMPRSWGSSTAATPGSC